MNKKVVILGARSEISRELSYLLAANYDEIVLAARNSDTLDPLRSHLELTLNTKASLCELDVLQTDKLEDALAPHLDASLVISVFGYLGDQEKAVLNDEEAARIMDVNYRSAVLILNRFANAMRERKEGVIVGISSVAGERGRKSNYIYGSAKAGFTAYLSGLRNDLYSDGVHVLTVKPGFMATPMTAHLDLPGMLTATPEKAAQIIVKAIRKKKNVQYVLPRWKLVMFIIRNIPEFMFKKKNL